MSVKRIISSCFLWFKIKVKQKERERTFSCIQVMATRDEFPWRRKPHHNKQQKDRAKLFSFFYPRFRETCFAALPKKHYILLKWWPDFDQSKKVMASEMTKVALLLGGSGDPFIYKTLKKIIRGLVDSQKVLFLYN